MAQADAPDGFRNAVAKQRLQPFFGFAPFHLKFGKRAHVQQPDFVGDMPAFLADKFKVVGAAEGKFLHHAPVLQRRRGVAAEQHIAAADFRFRQFIIGRRKPVGALPAVNPAENRAEFFHALVAGRGFQRRGGGAFFVGKMRGEHISVGLLVFFAQISARGVGPEAARIHAHHVHGRLAVHDPLGELPAGAAGRGDAETVPLVQPEIFQAPGRPDNRVAVRGVGDRAVVDLLDADFAECRHAVYARLNVRFQALQIRLK